MTTHNDLKIARSKGREDCEKFVEYLSDKPVEKWLEMYDMIHTLIHSFELGKSTMIEIDYNDSLMQCFCIKFIRMFGYQYEHPCSPTSLNKRKLLSDFNFKTTIQY